MGLPLPLVIADSEELPVPDTANGVKLKAELHHLALSSPDPERMASFYSRLLGSGIRRTASGLLVSGPDRRILFSEGPARKLVRAVFAVRDAQALTHLRERAAAAGVIVSSAHDELLQGETVSCCDPDGNRFVFGVAPPVAHAPSGSEPVARLQHLVFASTRSAELARFYEQALGFTLTDVVVDDEDMIRTAFLRCSSDHHSLAVFQAPEARLDHHCYEATDWGALKDFADRWAEERIQLVWGPGRHGPGNNLFIFVHDPDGNWVEVSAELEVVSDDRPAGRWPHEPRTLNLWGTALMRS